MSFDFFMYIPINIYLKVSVDIEKWSSKNVPKARSEGSECIEDTCKKCLTNNTSAYAVRCSQLLKVKKWVLAVEFIG